MKRKCSICKECKEETEFRFMKHRKNYNSYCKKCESWYSKMYKRAWRERKKQKCLMEQDGV